MKTVLSGLLFAALLSPLLIHWQTVSQAQVMSSSNYQIQSDSINSGGGFSSSTNYQQESTVGEIASGQSDSASYSLRAGYQQMQEVYIALTASADLVLSPSIPGVTGGESDTSTTVTVTTDSLAGYSLRIEAENSPALQSGGNTIADYVPAGGAPDFTFTTTATDAHFAYTPEGDDVAERFLDSGGVCGSGSDTTDRCWDGLTTSPVEIATRSSANHPAGTDTTVKFKVGVGSAVVQAPGVYTATTTLTAIPL